MASADPTIRSPKRKRDGSLKPAKTVSPSRLSTDLAILSPPGNEASSSPRTAVARHIQSLRLDCDKISGLDLGYSSHVRNSINDEDCMKKRIKTLEENRMESSEISLRSGVLDLDRVGETVEVQNVKPETPGSASQVEMITQEPISGLSLQADQETTLSSGSGTRNLPPKLSRAYPSIYRPPESRPRLRRRIGTPPISAGTLKADSEFKITFIDPDRAALTWHEDEITGHDPSDPDDDGEGINGIGFKPTPTQANARAEKRRQQMAEYRSREMKEARAKRSERRREGEVRAVELKDVSVKRVRFSDAGADIIITT